jgi:hypothetical protein
VDTQSCLSVGSVFDNRACLVLSVGSVIAGPLVVGPSVELLCCSTPGPGIPIHPHQQDLMNQEERRTGNGRHCRHRRGNQNNSGLPKDCF